MECKPILMALGTGLQTSLLLNVFFFLQDYKPHDFKIGVVGNVVF